MTNYNHIVCGRFDGKIHIRKKFTDKIPHRIRIGSTNPSKLKSPEFDPIATDGEFIAHRAGVSKVADFLENRDKKSLKRLIVLTSREKVSILEELLDHSISVQVMEQSFPVFSHIEYRSDIKQNLAELERLLIAITKLGFKGKSLAEQLSTEHLYKVERKLRFKNTLDENFALAYKGGYQEVFKLQEERKDRCIIAFDFNSMYADCMSGEFLEPKSIKYVDLRESNATADEVSDGLYHVVLKGPLESFFRNFHPLKYAISNRAFSFNLEKNQSIETALFKDEIIAYQPFFSEIEIIEGFCTPRLVPHPLYNYAKKIYLERLRHRQRGDTTRENLCKLKLVMIHSATNKRLFKHNEFKSGKDLSRYLTSKFGFIFSESREVEETLDKIQDLNYFFFNRKDAGYKTKTIDFSSNSTIFSLSAKIIANARIKMVKQIEEFLKHPSVEICYANIDSLHVSILKSERDAFLAKHQSIISDKIGDLKIQVIADSGCWLDLGRYWLFKENSIVQYKNQLFNHVRSKSPFTSTRRIKKIIQTPLYSFVKTSYQSLFDSFGYTKKVDRSERIDTIDFRRYDIDEVINLDVAGESFDKEILNSKELKMSIFKEMATEKVPLRGHRRYA